MNIHRNLFAGLANSVCSALIGLAVVPLYIKYLGIEAYGLVGFFATMQAVLQLFDLGLVPTINREVARYTAIGNLSGVGKLLHTLAVVYICVGLFIAIFVVGLAPMIAEFWLHPRHISSLVVEHAVMLMGLIIACHWPIAIYNGALIGAQRLTVASSINLSMSALGSLGAVLILAFISPTIKAFFLWQAAVCLMQVISMRWGAWQIVGHSKGIHFEFEELKRIWRFSAGMGGVAISAIILTQLDKMLLSKFIGLDDFGIYVLAGVVASGLCLINTPTFNVVYPRLSVLVASGDYEKLVEFYRTGTRLFAAVIFPITVVVVIFSEQLLVLWTNNQGLASAAAPVVSLLVIGSAINGVMYFPYALQLAFGVTSLPLKINIILVVIMIPTTVILALQFGVIGGAAAWALLNCIYLLLGTWLTHRSLLQGFGVAWFTWDVGMPIILSASVVGCLGMLYNRFGYSIADRLCVGAILALLAFVAIILVSPFLRNSLIKYFCTVIRNN